MIFNQRVILNCNCIRLGPISFYNLTSRGPGTNGKASERNIRAAKLRMQVASLAHFFVLLPSDLTAKERLLVLQCIVFNCIALKHRTALHRIALQCQHPTISLLYVISTSLPFRLDAPYLAAIDLDYVAHHCTALS